jgi:hypothetical protein
MLCLSLPTTKNYSGAHRSGKTRKNILVIHILESQTMNPKIVKSYNQIKMCMCMK